MQFMAKRKAVFPAEKIHLDKEAALKAAAFTEYDSFSDNTKKC